VLNRPTYGTWEPVVLMRRCLTEQADPVSLNANARHRGGLTRSSVDVFVTERRAKGLSYSAIDCDQPVREES